MDRLGQLKALHLYGMATAWSELLAEGPRRPMQPEAWLDRLIEAELADRQVRSLRYQLKAARFPVHRDLTGIDWAETPLPQAQVEQLATAHNLILVGGTGTGKTHIATALGVAAIHQGKRVRFYNAVDLVNQLEREKQLGRAGKLARQLVQTDAVIIDELGYLPFQPPGRPAVPPDQPALRKDLADCHHQPLLRGMGRRFRRPAHRGGLVHHSDRGSQYVAIKYTERLAEAGIEPSVGSVSDSYDNALAETINGVYKAEVIHRRRPWRSFEAVEFATLEWVDWFNHRRLLKPIGNIPPAEAEQRYFAMLEPSKIAA